MLRLYGVGKRGSIPSTEKIVFLVTKNVHSESTAHPFSNSLVTRLNSVVAQSPQRVSDHSLNIMLGLRMIGAILTTAQYTYTASTGSNFPFLFSEWLLVNRRPPPDTKLYRPEKYSYV
jgi:hypothetical protein